MKIIIPAAGIGSRLKPHTHTVPKSLIPVAGKPIIGHILDQVAGWGGGQIVMIVGHLRNRLEQYVAENYPRGIQFREQEHKLGLGHAVLIGLDPDDEDVLVILGDSIIDADLSPVIQRRVSAIGVKEVADPRKLGVVVVKNGRVQKLIEKPSDPPSNLAIVGVYYFRHGKVLMRAIKEVIERGITVKGEYQLTDALQLMVDWGEPLEVFPIAEWLDCGKPETLLEANRFLFRRGSAPSVEPSMKDALVIPPVSFGVGCHLENAIIGPYVTAGTNCVIKDSIVRDAIIGDDAHIMQALVENSLIGSRAVISGQFQRFNIGASSRFG